MKSESGALWFCRFQNHDNSCVAQCILISFIYESGRLAVAWKIYVVPARWLVSVKFCEINTSCHNRRVEMIDVMPSRSIIICDIELQKIYLGYGVPEAIHQFFALVIKIAFAMHQNASMFSPSSHKFPSIRLLEIKYRNKSVTSLFSKINISKQNSAKNILAKVKVWTIQRSTNCHVSSTSIWCYFGLDISPVRKWSSIKSIHLYYQTHSPLRENLQFVIISQFSYWISYHCSLLRADLNFVISRQVKYVTKKFNTMNKYE